MCCVNHFTCAASGEVINDTEHVEAVWLVFFTVSLLPPNFVLNLDKCLNGGSDSCVVVFSIARQSTASLDTWLSGLE